MLKPSWSLPPWLRGKNRHPNAPPFYVGVLLLFIFFYLGTCFFVLQSALFDGHGFRDLVGGGLLYYFLEVLISLLHVAFFFLLVYLTNKGVESIF
jgi:hypothetical protein